MTSPIYIAAGKRLAFYLGWSATEDSLKPIGMLDSIKASLQTTAFFGDTVVTRYEHPGVTCDLDLLCYVFDKDKKLIDMIRPGIGRDINESESIYHSGDQTDGGSGAFDEELFIELPKLPDDVAAILICTRVNNDFEVTPDTHVRTRIMNATDSAILLDESLPFRSNGEKGSVLGRLERSHEPGDDSWHYVAVNAYLFDYPDEDEAEKLAPYL